MPVFRTLKGWLPLAVVFLALACTVHAQAGPNAFFVSADGTPYGDGTVVHPWDLKTALSQPAAVRPGDTIWLRGGTYHGTFTANLNGTASAPIKIRQYPAERAIIDGGNSHFVNILEVSGSYAWYWGFEIMSSDPNRISKEASSAPSDIGRGGGVAIVQTSDTGSGLKFINLIIHDAAGGLGMWQEAVDAEVYGCLIYNNGWDAPDRGHGHGIYVQNRTSTKRIADNIIFNQYSHGIHAYSTLPNLDDLDIEGNVSFNNGVLSKVSGPARNILIGGNYIARNPKVINNLLYYPGSAGQNLNLGYYPAGAGVADAVVTGNYVANGEVDFKSLNQSLTLSGNSFSSKVVGLVPSLFPSNVYLLSPPTETQIFLRPNVYENGRATIVIYNWAHAASVEVTLESVLALGAEYEIRDSQNFFGSPVLAGTYSGGSVTLPMSSLSPAPPVGGISAAPTGPGFNVFIVLTTNPARVAPTVPSRGSTTERRD